MKSSLAAVPGPITKWPQDTLDDRHPWVEPAADDFRFVDEMIAGITEKPQPGWWWPMFLLSATLLTAGVMSAVYLISTGVGVWGSNIQSAGRSTLRTSCSGSASAMLAR